MGDTPGKDFFYFCQILLDAGAVDARFWSLSRSLLLFNLWKQSHLEADRGHGLPRLFSEPY